MSTLIDHVREDDQACSFNFPLIPIGPEDDSETGGIETNPYHSRMFQRRKRSMYIFRLNLNFSNLLISATPSVYCASIIRAKKSLEFEQRGEF